MLFRQYVLRFRVPSLTPAALLAILGSSLLAAGGSAQNPSYPAVPTPQPVSPNSLPSVPTRAAPPLVQGTPAAQAPTQSSPANPANPLDAPLPATPSQPGPSQPYSNPLEAPIPVAQPGRQPPSQSASPTDEPPLAVPPAPPASTPRANPLEQPVTLQPAQAPSVAPVEMPAPAAVASLPSLPTDYPVAAEDHKDHLGSTYIPDDSWVYPAALRLYSMGYLDSAFISMRPWTRRSLLHMLEASATDIQESGNDQAQNIYAKLQAYVAAEVPGSSATPGSLTPGTATPSSVMTRGTVYGLDTAYTRLMGIRGLTLRDSYHLGQTLVNDYGRPYQSGFNDITGFSSVNEWNRFSLYVRGEYQHAPSAAGYNLGLATYLSSLDEIAPFAPPNDPQATIPSGPIATTNPFRLQEAALSFHGLGHEISFGKTDAWLGPAQGGAMAWSNNAENIYSFRINRVEPLRIPYIDRVLGPLRYDFFVGSLKGHTFPNDPWVHSEMFSLRPTSNFEFSFQRTVIWGGKGHEPITIHTFLRSFFSLQDTETDPASKNSANDPGARYSDFSFSWRLPYLRHYVTLYTDSIAHDDVSPISAPRRAAYRPGVYISQFPGRFRNLDLRVEASSTDTSTLRSLNGAFNYFEGIQRNGYTNQGFIMGDWVGREAKAGDAWLTYHLSGNEWVQLSYLYKKTPKDFIQSGTTQNQFKLDVVKRLRPDLELDAWYQYEHWIAPVYQTSHQTDNVFAFQFTFYPKLRSAGTRLNGK